MAESITQTLGIVWLLFMAADRIVWGVAVLLGVVAGYILYAYTDDLLLALSIAAALLVSMMVANVAFTMLGIMFLGDRTANVVAAAGAALCSVTAIALVSLRLLMAIGDYTNRLKGDT